MALIKCTECEKEFSEYAKCCPNCGCPTVIVKTAIKSKQEIEKQEYEKFWSPQKVEERERLKAKREAEYKAERERLKQLGLCIDCGRQKATSHSYRCKYCQEDYDNPDACRYPG